VDSIDLSPSQFKKLAESVLDVAARHLQELERPVSAKRPSSN
jgi:hypothetical protein